jgi:hypothetical protein
MVNCSERRLVFRSITATAVLKPIEREDRRAIPAEPEQLRQLARDVGC